jgi:hypothetical protein
MRIHSKNFATLVGLIGLLSADGAVGAGSADATLVMKIKGDTIELMAPVSDIALTIPKGNLVSVEDSRSGAQTSPRYFHLADTGSGLSVSGWFEPESAFKGFEAFWKGEFSAMKRSGLIPMEPPTAVAVGDWAGAAYDISLPGGRGDYVSTHIRAELIKAGTWVDLHISITSNKPVADVRSEALEFLKSIVVTRKD